MPSRSSFAMIGHLLALALPFSWAAPTQQLCQQSCTSRVFEFGTPGFVLENLAVRSNGKVLFTSAFPGAAVYQVDPAIGNSSFEEVVSTRQLDGRLFALGIAETFPDVFALVSGNANETDTFNVHLIDFAETPPRVMLTNRVDEATLLNGIAPLPNDPTVLLVSDSYRGKIVRVDTETGKHSTVFQGAPYEAIPGSMGTGLLGVNGLRILGKFLYFINSSRRGLSRIAIRADGRPAGHTEVVANVSSTQALPDDFALRADGTAFITGSDEIVRIGPKGRASRLVGGPGVAAVAGGTSAQLGRGKQKGTLYVSGGIAPLNGVGQQNGFIEAIKLGCVADCGD